MMLSKVAMKTTAAAAGIATAGILMASPALADPQVVAFGQSAEIPSANGAEAINYTVNNLQPSGHNDGIWYSDVTATGVRGNATLGQGSCQQNIACAMLWACYPPGEW